MLSCSHTSHQMPGAACFRSFLRLHVCNAACRSRFGSTALALPRARVFGQALCSSPGSAVEHPGEGTGTAPHPPSGGNGEPSAPGRSLRRGAAASRPPLGGLRLLAVSRDLTPALYLPPGSPHDALTLITTHPAGKCGAKLAALCERRPLSNNFSI